MESSAVPVSQMSTVAEPCFRVVLSTSTSFLVNLFCSVPQVSVLGPRMFILYMADLADVVQNCQVNLHSFADDSQILALSA